MMSGSGGQSGWCRRPSRPSSLPVARSSTAQWPKPQRDQCARKRWISDSARARVSGCLAGKRVGFDVQVHEAEADRLELTASGPVAFDVTYDLRPGENTTEV